MYPTITAIAAYAAQQLEECRFWTVHSVYKKTVNLQSGERLLALQAASSSHVSYQHHNRHGCQGF